MNSYALSALLALVLGQPLEPIPDRLVVLTFDDASKSHFTVARQILKKHKFGATFFVTEGWDFAINKRDYLSWDEIAQLHEDGFEIGNHTIDHGAVTSKSPAELAQAIQAINERCREHGIPQPVSFAYPGNAFSIAQLPTLKALGIRFARRGGSPEVPYEIGGGFAYEPGLDHPLLVPTAGDARPKWTLDNLKTAVSQARHGRIAVLQFHGVPDTAHDWVSVPPKDFEIYMKYLADEKYTVIAMKDLARYVNPDIAPSDPNGVIEDRKKRIAAQQDGDNCRPAKNDQELRSWLTNALVHHRWTHAEAGASLGMSADDVQLAVERLKVDLSQRPVHQPGDALTVLPYPGGRHPRIGFRDGAIRPQRETKVSVFAPWKDGGYAVADVPEAVWFESAPGKPELLYLAHTHVPTIWDRQKLSLPHLEWRQTAQGLIVARELPNKVTLTSSVVPGPDGVRMEFRVTNGSEQTLTGLRIQMCVMLAGLSGFEQLTNDNKTFATPFAACRDTTGQRWIITGWERCGRAWGNPPCPCLHADPVVEDCPRGETRSVRGWLSFYEGDDLKREIERLGPVAFPPETGAVNNRK
ncbi:MAG: polysaccharide deacetylase family protein [Planctomycetes bacterium]|nr:polysaccharide deacetylase family protein [Planctomycetota bacterium]